MHLWQLEREADRCGRHRHQLQQVPAEILATLFSHVSICWRRRSAGVELPTLLLMPVDAGDAISAFQQQEGGVNRMHKNTERNAIKSQRGGNASGPAPVSQFWEIKCSSVVGPDASSRCNLS